MNFFESLLLNQVFMASFISWFVAQFLKVVLTLILDRKLDFYRMVGSGGMPSSHSSMVMGLSTAVGLLHGFESSLYAISFVFALIVMYDASGVRRAVGKQAIIINTMIEDMYKHKPISNSKLKELVGHTPYEVFIGALLGIFIANLIV